MKNFIKQYLKESTSFKKEDLERYIDEEESAWQGVMTYYYDKWNNDEFSSYADMVASAEEDNPLFALCILLGKLNYQVGNGGYSQYFVNGYASAGKDKRDGELLELTADLVQECRIEVPGLLEHLRKVYSMCDTNEECSQCEGSGEEEYEEEDEDGEIYIEREECYRCHGSGIEPNGIFGIPEYNADKLDSEYYSLKVEPKAKPIIEEKVRKAL